MGTFAELNDVLVILKDHSGDPGADVNGDFDISKKWSVIEFKDEFPQSMVITLNASLGRFTTRVPKIQKRDRIYVRITEKNGHITEDVFHVRRRKRKRGTGSAISLVLTCPHQSENLWKKTISFKKRGKRISGNAALALIVSDINAAKGAKDPTIEIPTPFNTITKLGNNLDENTSNNYIFESVKAETAVEETKDIEAQPVEGGGSFAPTYIRYKSKYDHSTGSFLDTVLLQAFEQGFKDDGTGTNTLTNIPTVTLTHPDLGSGSRPNILSLDTNEDPEEGTNLVAIGDKTSGSYTKEWMLYVGAKEVFESARIWSPTANYKPGHLVVAPVAGTYEAIANSTNTPPPNASHWIQRFFEISATHNPLTTYLKNSLVKFNDIAYKSLQDGNLGKEPGKEITFWRRISFAPTREYSELTKDKAQYWINGLAGAKFAATNNSRSAMIDPNVVIDDPLHPRIPVRLVTTDPINIPAEHEIGGNIPDAYLILVIDPTTGIETGTGDFAGSDSSGVPFAGNVAEYVDVNLDGTGFWRVFKGNKTKDDQEIFDWEETISWVKNPCVAVFTLGIPDQFIDGNGNCITFPIPGPGTRSTVWVKGAYRLSELIGVGKVGAFVTDGQFECVHSVKWDSINLRIDLGNEKIIEEFRSDTSAVFVKSAPLDVTRIFPFYVGFNFWSLVPLTSNAIPFGAVVAGERIKLPTLDLNNMDLTHNAKSEWFGPDVEDYYPFQAILAWLRLSINDQILGFLDDLDADFVLGIYMYDRQMNGMVVEFTHARNGKTLPMEGLLSRLKPFQGVPGTSAFFAAAEPSGVVAFDPTEFLFGGIYTRDSFDKQGRYLGIRSRFLNKSEMKMSIDAWRFAKPLVATNVDEPNAKPDFNIEPQKFQKQSITNYAQLKNFILGLEKFVNFDRREFNVEITNGRRINWGDPVYLTDTEALDDADDSLPNTVKVVADGITFSLSKTKKGPAGLKKFVRLVRRNYPT